jgi:hypothetical protein
VPIANPYAARHIPAQVDKAGLTLEPDLGSSAYIFPSEMLLRTQVLRRDAEDAVESGGLTRDIAEAAVREVHEAAARGLAFVAINVFGFVTRKPEAQVPELNTVSVQETSEPGSRAAKRPA